ncbi:MAG: cyclodeaminase/cyclohydrolase family protein [Candidatus Bipolaricaulota bacterium]|nr:cyclodeaminase/cyclohydrolase family protein [Candidatus Bipolaricaulota bacterium]MDW8110583.1 cyclodeaminase/cyclohydrolase family protein [Candidatus Bipolaricaulota bacterium]MDW8329505.1 cyclodeaminase/cyclohydrolase family protein [Candidatus Bipolaricaulota bacterium]
MTGELRITDFLERLAAATPTPGGGSAAALTASLAASLVAMVAALTQKARPASDPELAAQMGEICEEARRWRDRFLRLADEDALAFEGVLAAYRLPKDPERERRESAIQAALRQATEIPYEVALGARRVLELAEVVALKGLKSAWSDAGAGIYLAEAALQAALLNVAINIKSIKDEEFVSRYEERRRELSEWAAAQRRRVMESFISP